MPKTGIEPILKSYKESVLPIKLFRLKLNNICFYSIIKTSNQIFYILNFS